MSPAKHASLFLLVVAAVPWWTAVDAAGAAPPVDLLRNGGFEDGLAAWTPDPGLRLVEQPAEAHSGAKCLHGEVTEPNRALRLRQKVAVQARNRYTFEIWARATNRTKLVLWAVMPGQGGRRSIAQWKGVPRRWRKYQIPLTVAADGVLELEIIAPSSHGAPAGEIWVDDAALHETKLPEVIDVTGGKGFNDEPAMALAGDGSAYVAHVSFRQGNDSLQITRMKPEGKSYAPAGRWQVVGGEGTYVLGPSVVATDDGVAVLYAAEVAGNWDIYLVACGPDGPSSPRAVTTDPGVDIKPAAAWHEGTLWVAWESNRGGGRQVFAASVSATEVAEPVALSGDAVSAYGPTVAALAGGEICVAWHAFEDNNYDIFLRRRSTSGSWAPVVRLTRAPSIDRHPVLAAGGDDLWLVYENAQTQEYRIGATNSRRLVAAKVTPRGLVAPAGSRKTSPLETHTEGASAVVDGQGRLWIAYRKPRPPHGGWDVYLTCLAGDTWQRPSPLSAKKGMDRRPWLALAGDRVVVAFQADTIPGSFPSIEATTKVTSDVYLAAVSTADAPVAGRADFQPLDEPQEPFEAAEIRLARGEDSATSSIDYQGRALKLFFGDLHEHTEISVCNRSGDQSVDESYQHMRDIVRHDFACVTDHGYNISPYLWKYTAKLARVNTDPGRFLAFLGEEWTSTFEEYSEEHPYGFYGHRNLVFADPYFPRWWNSRNYQTPAQVWEDLRKMNADFIHIPHQLADTGNVPTDWNFADEVAQPVAEIFQIRGSYEYKGAPREAKRTVPRPGNFIQDAWARGVVIGVIASPDHGGGYGKACVYAPELTRQAVLEAIRARHCYGSTGAKIFLDVRVDGHLMGEKVQQPAAGSVEVVIRARCPGRIARIDVCRNNQFVYTKTPDGNEAQLTFVDRQPVGGRSYYYVRVIQEDEEIAWTSPVWFGVP